MSNSRQVISSLNVEFGDYTDEPKCVYGRIHIPKHEGSEKPHAKLRNVWYGSEGDAVETRREALATLATWISELILDELGEGE